jgi:predicted  nucleic acid-binding Zn-ribbon protein
MPTTLEEAGRSSGDVLNELVKRMNEYGRRIDSLEQRAERTEIRIGNVEQTAITHLNNLEITLESIAQNIVSLSERLGKIENEIARLNKELGKTALKSDIKKVEAFIDVVNPITSKFITREEAESMLASKEKRRA